MFTKWSSLAISVFSAVAIVQGASRSASLAKCGDDPAILSTKSFTHKGSEVVIKTVACPGISKPEKRSVPNKRQAFDQCDVGCVLKCVEFSNPTPVEADCLDLGEALAASTEFFTAPADSITSTSLGTCETSWINESSNEYEYCITDWGGLVRDVVLANCIPADSGGECVQTTGSDWLVEVFG